MTSKLIYDIGAHLGHDTLYYLEMGYTVVAVEPIVEYCRRISNAATVRGQHGRLLVLPAACTKDGAPCELYLSAHSLGETHSVHPSRVRNPSYDTKTVAGLTIPAMITNLPLPYGSVPHYIKIDIEGADILPIRQLASTNYRPKYLSVELDHRHEDDALEIFFLLWGMGYRSGTLVNGSRVREGQYGKRFVGGGYTGPFGEALSNIQAFEPLNICVVDWMARQEANEHGDWYDLHVKHQTAN